MITNAPRSNANRFGRWLGRMWRAWALREREAATWLVNRGVPVGGAAVLLWTTKLVVLGLLLYAVFWLGLLLVFAGGAAWVARNSEPEPQFPEPEWKSGPAGYGLYTYDGYRIDPHVFEED